MPERISQERLEHWTASVLAHAGLTPDDARRTAGTFVLQQMRGVEHHGLARLPALLDSIRDGRVNPRPALRVIRETSSVALLDGDHGPGILACHEAMSRAIDAARTTGFAMAVVRNSGHFLAAAPYCLQAADEGLIGIAFSNAGASMAYPGAHRPILSNGPFGYAVPTGLGFAIVFDAAMTASGGQLIDLAQRGEALPPWLGGIDAAGRPTNDPASILDRGATFPIGMHKGAGLVLLFELLTGVLGGGAFLQATAADQPEEWQLGAESQCCIAIAADQIEPGGEFIARVDAYAAALKANARPDEVMLPGERASEAYRDAQRNAVPIGEQTLRQLVECGRSAGIPFPGDGARRM
jgi:LDH2 family malate/lactate/ureidoglycolate dehydrogenase